MMEMDGISEDVQQKVFEVIVLMWHRPRLNREI